MKKNIDLTEKRINTRWQNQEKKNVFCDFRGEHVL